MTRVTFEESVKALSKPPKKQVEPKHEQVDRRSQGKQSKERQTQCRSKTEHLGKC